MLQCEWSHRTLTTFEEHTNMRRIATTSLLLGLMAIMSGCVLGPREGYREGYYDRGHNRYYHEHSWHDCGGRDEHCR
jgi:hypothetical protein